MGPEPVDVGNAVISQIAEWSRNPNLEDLVKRSPIAMAVLQKLGEAMEKDPFLVKLEGDHGPQSRSHNSVFIDGDMNDTQKLAQFALQNESPHS